MWSAYSRNEDMNKMFVLLDSELHILMLMTDLRKPTFLYFVSHEPFFPKKIWYLFFLYPFALTIKYYTPSQDYMFHVLKIGMNTPLTFYMEI